MSISHLSLVNQKLAYASAIVSQLNASLIESKLLNKLQQQALGDAAVFHLSMALHFYLRELAEHHRIKQLSTITSVEGLVSVMEQADKVSSESSELLDLIQTNGTWLNQLTAYYGHLFQSPVKPKEKKAFGLEENRVELIELTEVEANHLAQLTPELLAFWVDSFRALVIRQRETTAEY